MTNKAPALIVYFEIPAPDIEKAGSFYRDIFGWTVTPSSLSSKKYWEISTGDGQLTGGLDASIAASESGIIFYLKVDDIAFTLKKVCEAGGSIIRDRFDIGGGYGYSAIFKDPNGNLLGLFSKT